MISSVERCVCCLPLIGVCLASSVTITNGDVIDSLDGGLKEGGLGGLTDGFHGGAGKAVHIGAGLVMLKHCSEANMLVFGDEFGGLTGAGGTTAPRPNLHWFSVTNVSRPPWPQSHHW